MKLQAYLTSGTMPGPSPKFSDESERLRALESFDADALEDDPELKAIASFAAKLCNVPVSQVTLVEQLRQHHLVSEGFDVRETPREVSFCAHTLGTPAMLVIPDATDDTRFKGNALVTGWPELRFYAGQPLISDEGASLGALCVIDMKPHPEGLNEMQREGMAVLAQAVMRRLNARRNYIRARAEIDEREEQLRRMIEGVPQVAWSADQDGVFDYFNRRWQEMTGGQPPRMAEDWRPFIHPEDQDHAFAAWYEAFARGQQFESKYRLHRADGSWCWVLAQALPVTDREDGTRRWFGTITDIDEVYRLSETRELLSRELAHRIKNIFAVVIGLLSLKARNAPEHMPFAEDLTSSLRALASAHEFVRVTGAPVEANLQALLASLFSAYRDDRGEPRVHVSGADFAIAPATTTPIALVFHELATNSAKYGALSQGGGTVTLDVEAQGETLVLTWREIGGPPVRDEGRRGFGSRLVEMSVKGQLQGEWERRFEPGGLVAELRLPRAVLEDS